MTRAKKILSGSLVALLVLLLVGILVANRVLESYSRQALTGISQRSKRQGVVISEPWFRHARIAGPRTARWTNLSARLRFPRSEAFDARKTFDVSVGQLDLWLTGGGQASIEARDIAVNALNAAAAQPAAPDDQTEKEEICADRFRCQLPFDLFHPVPSLEEALPELVALVEEGTTPLRIESEGTLQFTLKGAPVKVRMRVERGEAGRALVLVPDDLRPVSELFEEALTDAEIELIAGNPLRAATLLWIKDDAETTAAAAKQKDDQVPQDAYRHVLWSFLLTREYDAQFAQRVTDAHEQGDTGNTPAEREMDYHNNAVGRGWAENEVGRNAILSRVMSDPDVIREPK
jgi:hypothetical protein